MFVKQRYSSCMIEMEIQMNGQGLDAPSWRTSVKLQKTKDFGFYVKEIDFLIIGGTFARFGHFYTVCL